MHESRRQVARFIRTSQDMHRVLFLTSLAVILPTDAKARLTATLGKSMKTLRAFLFLVVLSSASHATTPMSPPRIDVAFDEFQQFMPEKFEYWRKFIQTRVPRPSDEWRASMWDGLEVCSSHVKADCIPAIRRAFAEKKNPDELVLEFEHLITAIDDFQWCLSEFLIVGISKKQIALDDRLQEDDLP
jgi:hypothetical protein